LLLSLPLSAEGFRTLTMRKQEASAADGGKVFTLGDSYSSGVGLHSGFGDYDQCSAQPLNFCCRDYTSTAGAIYAKGVGKQYVNVACGGSHARVMGGEQFPAILANPKFSADVARQFENDVIHFTIGGNDIRTNSGRGWEGTVVRCLQQFNCRRNSENQVNNLGEIEERLVSIFGGIATNASKARIRAMGYPLMAGWKSRWWPCLSFPGLRRDDAAWLDSQVDKLNGVIQRSVARTRANHPGVDFKFVDVKGYLPNGGCERTGKDVWGLDVVQWPPVSPKYLHPTPQGYRHYAAALRDSLN